jgi:hypothetical protein
MRVQIPHTSQILKNKKMIITADIRRIFEKSFEDFTNLPPV